MSINKACLVLNASYEPVAIIKARRAITLMVKDVARCEESYGREVYPGIELPSVIRLYEYKKIPIRLSVAKRKNILSRDRNRCQYCQKKFHPSDLTLDHIIPQSKGGRGTWDNLVASCGPCNHRKADRTPEEAGMKLAHKPRSLSIHTSRYLLRLVGLEEDKTWEKYLYA